MRKLVRRQAGYILILLLMLALLHAPHAAAQDLFSDPLPCPGRIGNTASLVAAIEAANALGTPQVITLRGGCTYFVDTPLASLDRKPVGVAVALDTALPPITGNITIRTTTTGEKAIIQRFRVGAPGLNVPPFRHLVVRPDASLTLENITLTNGAVCPSDLIPHSILGIPLSSCNGGSIYNEGSLTLSKSTLSNNSAYDHGGGIFNSGGTLSILSSSTLSGNSASFGAGISNRRGNLTIQDSALSSNTAPGDGGGIINEGSLTLSNSTLSGNSADSGGGIANRGTLSILSNSTLSGNSARIFGGGILNVGGKLTIQDSALSSNTAHISGGGIYNFVGTLSVSSSTLSGNSARNNGGGIFNDGTLGVSSSTLSGNSAGNGGGIFNHGGTLTIQGSALSSNTALAANPGGGGGIYNSGQLTIKGSATLPSLLTDNQAPNGIGGGILNVSAQADSLTNTTLSNNRAGDNGGGIFNVGTLSVSSSTLSGNSTANSDSSGGGIQNHGTVTLSNSTISGNSAHNGGGIVNGGTLRISFSTIAFNTAPNGGGIFGSSTLKATIVSNNTGRQCAGTMSSAGYNLASDISCSLTGPGDLQNTNPQLGPLRNNGGQTQTHAIPPDRSTFDSPAHNAIPVFDCEDLNEHPVTTDQRGVKRRQSGTQNHRCDIGAFEL